jgi:iron-sulfur cluster repair protein YtfE (RIC family)
MRVDTISRYLAQDHQRLDALVARYFEASTRDTARAAELFFQYRDGLVRHMLWEEEILFPLHERNFGPAGDATLASVKDEHRVIEQLLEFAAAQVRLGSPGAPNEVRRLEAVMTRHEEHEMNVLYPEFDKAISDRDVLHLIRSMDDLPERRNM